MKYLKFLTFALLIAFSCKEKNEYDYPIILTGEVTDIDSTGAVFHAKLTESGKSGIVEYGFVWSENENPDLNSSKLIITEKAKTGTLDIKVSTDLNPDTYYYVRAFASNDIYTTFGRQVRFLSKGSLLPLILDFSPKEGGEGTEVTITGKNFSNTLEGNKVWLGKVSAVVTEAEREKLVVRLPEIVNISGRVKIKVETSGRTVESADLFRLPGCDILGFTPGKLMVGDEIHLGASGIDHSVQNNILFIGGSVAEIYSITDDSIFAYVNNLPVPGDYEISLSVNGKTAYALDLVQLISPYSKIDGPNSFFRSGSVGFSIGNKGYIGMGMLYGASFKKDLWEYNPADNTWKPCSDMPGNAQIGEIGFSVGGKGYVCLGTKYEDPQPFFSEVYEYDPEQNRWTRKADFPGEPRVGSVCFVIGNKAYLGCGYNQYSAFFDFWEYTPETDNWKQIQNFPGAAFGDLSGFTINGKGYAGSALSTNREFWEYDPSMDTWKRIADFPGTLRALSVCFSLGQTAYIGTGLSYYTNEGYLQDFWKYEISKDKWIRIADMPYRGRASAAVFTVGNKAYICSGVNDNPAEKNEEEFIVFNSN